MNGILEDTEFSIFYLVNLGPGDDGTGNNSLKYSFSTFTSSVVVFY